MHNSPSLPNRPKAYSYVRFSTPEQMKGDSFRRQVEAAERYAATHGLEIDPKFTFHDLGVSAFQGRNKTDGMLGEFLSFAREGDIERGSYLLVENLDRVSRENALDALDTLKDIAKEGITVVTLNDGREYTYESLRRNPIDLMVAVMMFMRANEESEVKARRLREAWSDKRKHAKTKPLSAISPGWVRLLDDRSAFEVIPERAAIVRRVFDMTLDGIGQHTIAMKLNREEVPVFGRGKMWQRSYINKMLQDPAVIGNFTPHRVERIDGRKVRVATETIVGYFPAVVERETFDRVMVLSNGRTAGPLAPTANILAGLAKCPKCSSSMTRINKGGKKGGKPYLVCSRAKVGAGCEYRQVRLHEVEDAILTKAFELLVALPSPEDGVQAEWDKLTMHRDVIGEEVERLVGAIAEAGHSRALLDRLRDIEKERDRIAAQLSDIEVRIVDTLTNRIMRTTTELVDATEEAEGNVPKINAIMRQLFERVTVDWAEGKLWFHWKHAPEEMTGIMYAWPKVE